MSLWSSIRRFMARKPTVKRVSGTKKRKLATVIDTRNVLDRINLDG